MRYGSVFAGIGGFDLGLERAGMVCAWQAELDKAASAVLARHWPQVKRYRHVESINYRTGKAYRRYFKPAAVDVICGGFPCQDVSLAGKRAGLAGKRSGLWFEFHRILAQHRPAWTVIENVPGLLSSNGGRDFAIILRGLVELGYGVAWRVLDAQFFGVAQRRRRVFIVGHLGDGRAAEVLFEREGSPGDTPPRREAGERLATDVAASLRGVGGGPRGFTYDAEQGLVAATLNSGGNSGGFRTEPGEHLVARSLTTRQSRLDGDADNFVAFNIQHNDGGAHKRKDRPNGGMYVSETDVALTVGTTDLTAVAFQHTLRGFGSPGIADSLGVRRLTPLECERLQGFPDDWTVGQPDSARYKQCGNAVAVPCAEWIGRRIMQVVNQEA